MIDQYNTLAERFLRKGFWLYLFSFIIAPIWYIIKIIISWELSVSEVWILYWVISLIVLVSSFNDFWMTESLKHFLPDFITKKNYDKVKLILIYAIIAQVSTWLIIAWFFFFWADFIANNYFKTTEASWILKIFALYFLWINIFQIISTFFIAVQNTLYNKLIELFRMSFVLISVLSIFFLNVWNMITYSYSWIIWLYIGIIFSITIFYKKYYREYLSWEKIIWDKKLFLKVFKYAIWVLLWAQASTILSQIDMQMIIYILGTEEAWYYTNYLSIIQIPFMIIWPIFWLLFPIFSEMHSKWDHKKINLIKEIFTKNLLIIWIAFNIFLFVFAHIIVYILFWEKFIVSWNILRYSILFLIFNFMISINFNVLWWIWKVKERVKIILIALVFNFFTNLLFINLIWVSWAALATWIWWFLIWVLSEIYLWKKYKIKYNYYFLIKLFKNIIIILLLWTFYYYFVIQIFEWLSRLKSLYLIVFFSIIWFWIFILINYNDFKNFILEVKKIKK